MDSGFFLPVLAVVAAAAFLLGFGLFRGRSVYRFRGLEARVRAAARSAGPGLRLPVDGGGEAARLAQAVNLLLEDLDRAKGQAERFFSAISSLVIGLDAGNRVLVWNHTAERVLGLARSEVLERPLEGLDLPLDSGPLLQAAAQCRREQIPCRLETLAFRRQDGSDGALGFTLSPTPGPDGPGALLLGADITGIQARQERRNQEQKMQAIGRLASGLAHEIQSPVRSIADNLAFLRDAFADLLGFAQKSRALARDGAEALEQALRDLDLDYLAREAPLAVSQSLGGVERVRHILASMRQLSHPGGRERREVDVNALVHDVRAMTRGEWRPVAAFELDLDARAPTVYGFPVELGQVLLNLVLNATQAVAETVAEGGGKGRIRVSTRGLGAEVEIAVSDNGPGVAEAIAGRIFDPFFTTKDVGQGTGQGLAVSLSIVAELHGGSLTFENNPDGGAVFRVRLPAHPGEQPLP